MTQADRLEIQKEIRELELRLENARSRLQEAHNNVAYRDSPDSGLTDSMFTTLFERNRRFDEFSR